MTTKPVADVMREAAAAVPSMRWTRSGATVGIPDTEDWAGTPLSITGLHRPIGRAYARHIAAASPANVLDMLEQRDELLAALDAIETAAIADEWCLHTSPTWQAIKAARPAIAKAKGEQQ